MSTATETPSIEPTEDTATPTETATAEATATPTEAVATETPTVEPTEGTATPSETATPEATPTETVTPEATATPTEGEVATHTPTVEPTEGTATPTEAVATATPTTEPTEGTATPTETVTQTPEATATPSETATTEPTEGTATPEATATATATATASATETATPEATPTPTEEPHGPPHSLMRVGSTQSGSGALGVDAVPTAFVEETACLGGSGDDCQGGFVVYAGESPGFNDLLVDNPGLPLFKLPDGVTVSIEITAIDADASVLISEVVLDGVGDTAVINTSPHLHNHPSWQIVAAGGTLPVDKHITFRLSAPGYQTSEPITVTLSLFVEPTSTPTPEPTATPTLEATATETPEATATVTEVPTP